MLRTALLTLACATALAGCEVLTAPHGAEIETRAVYTLPPEAALQATFTVVNHGPGAVDVPTCGDRIAVGVERAEGDAWAEASGSVCPANLSSVPLTLQDGERVQGAVPFGAGGTFRVRLHLLNGPQVVSRSFTVR
ncbi:MAG TPA: hypothetical protein VFH27_15805 [Longimicrobiaceae bacterium]|nr:hypothetical protein [Longimicrobiaceae bacterium]